MKHVVLLTIIVFCMICSGQTHGAEKKIGLIPAPKFDKGKGIIKAYQQTVWEQILAINRYKSLNCQMVLVEENELTSFEKLRRYQLIIIPSARETLPVGSPDVFKEYIKSGGWLIRDWGGPFCLDIDGDGILSQGDLTEESREALKKFWQEIAGASEASKPVFNLIRKIRAAASLPSFTGNLSSEFMELDLTLKMPHLSYNCAYYQLSTAKALAEAVVINIPTNNFQAEGKELDGIFPVVAVNQYGKGACVSLGINIRAMLKPPAEFYTGLLYNIFSQALKQTLVE